MSAFNARASRWLVAAMTIALMALAPRSARAQLSPGVLARAHAGLEGATNCTKCHGLRREPMSQLCVGCHRDVQWGIDQGRGLHAREIRQGNKECASCHPDHAGASFALIAWPEGTASKFDHRRAGWALDGKHADTRCEGCHRAEFRLSPAASLSPRKSGPGWMGLETTCVSCHQTDDVHNNALGTTCNNCHDAASWKSVPTFDHARTRYPLQDKHVDVACDACHLAPRLGVKANAQGQRIPRFKPLAFTECSSCHNDPHKGQLSSTCSDCHVTRGFNVINQRAFNHALTRYPLAGRHRAATCERCHGNGLATARPAFATCGACHADPHRGEAMLAGKSADCAACHRVEGFAPSTFTVAQHAGAAFALGGAHQTVKCASCHTPFTGTAAGAGVGARAVKNVRMRPPSATCGACHADAHGNQLASTDEGVCARCHSDAGWKPSTFAKEKHAALRVTLDGRHGAVACAACHATARPGLPALSVNTGALGRANVLLRVPETACASCHVDPHGGRYATASSGGTPRACTACHDARAFRPSVVDVRVHATFSFALDGAHRATPCVACHAEMKTAAAASTLLLSARGVARLPFSDHRETSCQSCHATPHGTQFNARTSGAECIACHTVDTFVPAARFEHARDASFSLAGAHAKVACASCHTRPQGNATAPVMYRGVSAKCESCHSGAPSRRIQ